MTCWHNNPPSPKVNVQYMLPISSKVALLWLRRDLRLEDHAALYHALRSGHPVLPLFILDRDILDTLPHQADPRVTFIHDTLGHLHQRLHARGSTILVRHGFPLAVWQSLLEELDIAAVYASRDHEPSALARDQAVQALLRARGIPFHTFKDHLILDGEEVLKDGGEPYTVFTPYSKKWKAKLEEGEPRDGIPFYLRAYPVEPHLHRLLQTVPLPIPSLQAIGFQRSALEIPGKAIPDSRICHYHETRDFPAQLGTSRLGIHLRFGTVSIREAARKAHALNPTYLQELIWRDFYAMILHHFPHVAQGPFKPRYAAIPWRNDEAEFAAWCSGHTGYPLVDAGMRELNATGFMHNRVRMVTASFLTKHLLVDWRWGEAYFAQKLLDFDLASNNGGWQWAAGCGTDAAPYFRIFNPAAQQRRFDPHMEYVRRWVPEHGTAQYPPPIVDHAAARARCLRAYSTALK